MINFLLAANFITFTKKWSLVMQVKFNEATAHSETYAYFSKSNTISDKEDIITKVNNQEISKLDIPEGMDQVFFYDNIDGTKKNYSQTYLIAKKILDVENIAEEVAENCGDLLLKSNENWVHLVETVTGNVTPITKDIIVIDKDKDILYQAPKKAWAMYTI